VLAQRLSTCHVSGAWTHERAEEWWRVNVPTPEHDRLVADVLRSREGPPRPVRALRLRRGLRAVQ
jgi:hypothetical protein